MVKYNLNIGIHKAQIIPLAIKMQKLEDVDEEGNAVKKIYISKSEYKWIRIKDNKEVEKTYKALNGKIFRKLARTTEILKYEKITKEKALDLNTEKNYLVISKSLEEELKDEAILFYYSNGNGFKVYNAVIYRFNKHLIMSVGIWFKSDIIKKMDITTGAEVEEEKIERAKVEDIIPAIMS